MTPNEARLLAAKIRNSYLRQEISDEQWSEVADIVANHKKHPHRPLLDDADREGHRIQRAQHHIAWDVLEWQKIYRQRNNCKSVPAAKTAALLTEAIEREAVRFRVTPEQLSVPAIRNIIKNNRPSVQHPKRPFFSTWHNKPTTY